MKEKTIFEELGGTYREENGVFYPDVELSELTHYPIGKYGDLHLQFIKQHRRGRYATLLTQFKLNEYLHQIDTQAREKVKAITEQIVKSREINENLKVTDQLRWVQEMNAANHDAEEIVFVELIYT